MRPIQGTIEIPNARDPITSSYSQATVSQANRMSASYRASRDNDSTLRLILVPSLISLVVTLWRLTGELLTWSQSWFNPEAGGQWAIIGITWLAPFFGVYFALELHRRGQPPASWTKALGLSLASVLIMFAGGSLQTAIYQGNPYGGLIYLWIVGIAGAAMVARAWPPLFKTLLAYGLAVRLPVIVIMFLAIWGQWGTHYDAIPAGFPAHPWFIEFLLLGFFPQMLFWISFTIVTGMFFGTLAARIAHLRKPAR